MCVFGVKLVGFLFGCEDLLHELFRVCLGDEWVRCAWHHHPVSPLALTGWNGASTLLLNGDGFGTGELDFLLIAHGCNNFIGIYWVELI